MARPFEVRPCCGRQCGVRRWALRQRRGDGYVFMDWFPSQASAIDFAYKNWPWWP